MVVFLRSLHITLNKTGMRHKGPSPSATHQTSPEVSKQMKVLVLTAASSTVPHSGHVQSRSMGLRSTILCSKGSFEPSFILGKKMMSKEVSTKDHTWQETFFLSVNEFHFIIGDSQYLPLTWEHLEFQFLYTFFPKACNVSEDHYIEVLLCRLIWYCTIGLETECMKGFEQKE